jgi:hypothetical protein
MPVGSSSGSSSGAIRAGAAYVELLAQDNQLLKGLRNAEKRVAAFSKFTQDIGKKALAVGVAALTPVGIAIESLGRTSDLDSTAKAFGLTAVEASRLFGIMGAAGSNMRDATEGLVTFGQRVSDALAGRGDEAVTFFNRLGVAAEEFDGLNPAEQFYKLLEALRQVEDPGTRVQLLLKAVGEDTGKNLIKVLGMSADQMRQVGDASEVTAEELKAASEATKSWRLSTALLGRAWDRIAIAIGPVVSQAARWISEQAITVGRLAKEYAPLIAAFVKVAAAITAAGAALYTLGIIGSGIASGFGVAATAVSLLLSPISAIAGFVGTLAGIGSVTAPFAAALAIVAVPLGIMAYKLLPAIKEGFLQAFEAVQPQLQSLGKTFASTWGGIGDAIKSNNLKLALEIAMAGLDVAWTQGLEALSLGWDAFLVGFASKTKDAFKDVAPALLRANPVMNLIGEKNRKRIVDELFGGFDQTEKDYEAELDRAEELRDKAAKLGMSNNDDPVLAAALNRRKAQRDELKRINEQRKQEGKNELKQLSEETYDETLRRKRDRLSQLVSQAEKERADAEAAANQPGSFMARLGDMAKEAGIRKTSKKEPYSFVDRLRDISAAARDLPAQLSPSVGTFSGRDAGRSFAVPPVLEKIKEINRQQLIEQQEMRRLLKLQQAEKFG